MDVRILGPFEVRVGGRVLELGGRRPRALLAALVLRAWEPVSTDRLVDELWGEDPPPSAHHLLHVYVSSLRKQIGARLVTRAPGYLLELGEDELDARRFELLVGEGRGLLAAGDHEGAAATLGEALALWRGSALADFTYEPFAQSEIARLEELRLLAHEDRLDADLALGRHGELVGELEALVAEHPLRERSRGQLMLALYRSGRQAKALEAYREGRRLLVDELGIEPGRILRDLEQAMLRQDTALDVERAADPVAARGATRKLVTIVAASLMREAAVDALDPEVRTTVVGEALDLVSGALSRHGGAVNRSAGEEIVAVFGVPAAHEDDALRAVRGAFNARDAVAGHPTRFGIETGEVVVEADSVTGSVVLAAVDLSREAEPGDVVAGPVAYKLVRHAVVAEPSQTGDDAYRRLLAVRPDAPALPTRSDAPFVGRTAELEELQREADKVFRNRVAAAVTIVGDAGLGKSRLARELVAAVEREATVLIGRCASHGEELTFEPVRQMIAQVSVDSSLEGVIAPLDQTDRTAITAALGVGDSSTRTARREETFRALARLFSLLARERPVVVIFEDAHWAEAMLLEFVEHLAKRLGEVPVLVLCLARPDLLAERPAWMDQGRDDLRITLEPLSNDESKLLLEGLATDDLADGVRAEVVALGEGNPLFLEQMAAMLSQQPSARWDRDLPPTIRALLAARLDRLGPAEKAVAERASIIGRDFTLEGVLALLQPEAQASAPRHLRTLERRRLVEVGEDAGEGTFRFRHALIHEAAYRAIPKAVRFQLHERLADWLEGESGRAAHDLDETAGYHLERAFRYRSELAPTDSAGQTVAKRASAHLASAGSRAFDRGDVGAATGLFERSLGLPFEDRAGRAHVAFRLAIAHALAGNTERARECRSDALDGARATADRRLELRVIVAEAEADRDVAGIAHTLVDTVIPELTERGDDLALARAWSIVGHAGMATSRHVDAEAALLRALEHAERAGDAMTRDNAAIWLANVLGDGPTPADRALERIADLRSRVGPYGVLGIGGVTGLLLAMQGRFDDARRLHSKTRAQLEELGVQMVGLHGLAGEVELLAGDPLLAERALAAGCDAYAADGQAIPWIAERRARALRELGRLDDAESMLETARGSVVPAETDIVARIWATSALIRLDRGDSAEAVRHALEADRLSEPFDAPPFESPRYRGEMLLSVAEVLSVAGRGADGVSRALAARRKFEQKRDVVSATRASALAARLGTATLA